MNTSVSDIIKGIETDLLIDGAWVAAESGKRFDVENPATGEILASVADGDATDARRAIEAAAATQSSWAATSPRERSEILYRAYELLTERADDVAAVMTAEMGKPLAEAKGEVAYGAEFFRWFAEEAVRIGGDHTTTGDGANRIIVTHEPVGPCILITPWNFPLAMGTRKIGPAIAAGCTIVFKPAELTPLTSLMLAGLLIEAGLPAGVLNIVNTTNAASVATEWMESGLARKVSFTGSTEVGKILLRQAAGTVMRTSMELGGNAPFIVCDDADLDRATDGLMVAKMRNIGQACTAANRIFVHRSVFEEFSAKVIERMSAVTVGPLVEEKAVRKVESLVADATERGARIRCGGHRVDGPGHFYPATVLTDVDPDADIVGTEIFGPVASLIPFDGEGPEADQAVLDLANNTPWGLVGYLFSQDIDRIQRLAAGLEVGMVGVNTGLVSNPAAPFGGVKESGLGREGGKLGIEEFLEVKYWAVPIPR